MMQAAFLLEPVLAVVRSAAADAPPRDEDVHRIAFRLLHFLRNSLGAGSLPLARIGDCVPFFWSYVDVDCDLHGWQSRLPFVDVVDRLLLLDGRPRSPEEWSKSLRHAAMLASLSGRITGKRRWAFERPLADETEFCRQARRLLARYQETRWCIWVCLRRHHMSFAWDVIGPFMHGSPRWTGILEQCEEPFAS